MKPLLISLTIVLSINLAAFGQTGHRVAGQIAEKYLSDKARVAVKEILGNQSLAEVSTYFDEQRANPSEFWQKTANPWHYMTVPDGQTYHDGMAPEEGDAITAIRMYTKRLRDPDSSREEKALAIKFLVHTIADLHQPLHVGNGTDRGGNDFKVQFFNGRTNLHRVWDSGMIDRQQLSFTEWTAWLDAKITPAHLDEWRSTDPLVWAKESQELRMGLYPKTERLSQDYQYQHIDTIKLRLSQAGVRIAFYLNEVFESS